MELILTVSNLKNEYSHLILDSSLTSITNTNRMVKNVRESIEKQLQHQFENVMYMKGKKGEKSHFIVSGENGNSLDGYKSGGRNSVILEEDINCYLNFISQQEEKKELANGKKVVNDFTILELLSRCFKLNDCKLSAKCSYLKSYEILDGLNLVENAHEVKMQRSSDFNLLNELVRDKLREQAGKYLDWTLKKNNITYYNTYYKIKIKENKDGKKIEVFDTSTKSEYDSYKKKYSQILAYYGSLGQKVRQAKINTEKYIIEEYGYKLVFKKYVFHDNKNLYTNNYHLENCKKRLFVRLKDSVSKKQIKFESHRDAEPNEYVDFRLLKSKEYSKLMIQFYEAVFHYSPIVEEVKNLVENLDEVNNINILLERYQESKNLQSIKLLREIQGNSNISESIKSLAKDKSILDDENVWKGLTDWMVPVTVFDYIRLKQTTDKIIILCFNDKAKTIEMKDELIAQYEEISLICCRQKIVAKNNEELLNQLPYGVVKKLEIVLNKYEKELQSKFYYDSSFDEIGQQFIA